jgi:hypothetical protein
MAPALEKISREDFFGALATIFSSLVAAVGFLWSIGFLQLIFTFLTGAFATYVVQHRLGIESERRRNERQHNREMRDKIYGPIFTEISTITNGVEFAKTLDLYQLGKFKEVMNHYLYFTVKQELKRDLSELLDRCEKYENLRRATELMLQKIIRKEIEDTYHIDVDGSEHVPNVSLFFGEMQVAFITLIHMLLLRESVQNFLSNQNKKWQEDLKTEVNFGGGRGTLDDFASMRERVLAAVKENVLYENEKKQRDLLVNALHKYLEQIKPFVNLT